MSVSISLHWKPPLHFHGWERARPVFTAGPRSFQPPKQQVSHSWGTLGFFSLLHLFPQKDAAQSPESWKLDRWDKWQSLRGLKSSRAERVFSSCKSSRFVSPSENRQPADCDTKAAAGRAGDEGLNDSLQSFWRVWGIKGSTGRHRWMHHSGFNPALSVSPDYFTAFEQQAALKQRAAWSGSGQSWPQTEYVSVICCWGFDPDSLHQIWNKTCVFASITVSRGAGMLRGGTGAILRCFAGFSRKETLSSSSRA